MHLPRRLLRRSDALTPLREELSFVDDYLSIERVRFGDKLQVVREVDDAARTLRFGAFRFDLARSELFRGGEIVRLTAAEAGLLSSLAARAGQPVSREDLSQSAQFRGNIRNVDVQMTRLRRKIEPDPRYPRYLHTVRGTGYALKPE